MISNEVIRLERENENLKGMLEELSKKMEQKSAARPKSCQYCMNYIQHYIKGVRGYTPIYDGHCTKGVPIKRGGKRNPKPDDTCPYFELGTHEIKR